LNWFRIAWINIVHRFCIVSWRKAWSWVQLDIQSMLISNLSKEMKTHIFNCSLAFSSSDKGPLGREGVTVVRGLVDFFWVPNGLRIAWTIKLRTWAKHWIQWVLPLNLGHFHLLSSLIINSLLVALSLIIPHISRLNRIFSLENQQNKI
jgi:hypothetical protein